MGFKDGAMLQALKDGVQDVAVKVLAASQFSGIPEGLQLQVLKKVSTGRRVRQVYAQPPCGIPATLLLLLGRRVYAQPPCGMPATLLLLLGRREEKGTYYTFQR